MLWRPSRRVWSAAAPPGPVFTLPELKLRLRLGDDAVEDADIADILAAATAYVERETQRLLTARTCTLRLPGFPPPGWAIELRGGRVGAVSAVTWRDDAGTERTLAADTYALFGESPARLEAVTDLGWPTAAVLGLPVTVTYTAGYPPPVGSPTDYGGLVPEELRTAVASVAGELYEQRREGVHGPVNAAPLGARHIIAGLRVRAIG